MKTRSWIVPVLITAALLGYLGWIIAKGLGHSDQRFFRTEVAPGISGMVQEPGPGSAVKQGIVLLPRTAGWDADQGRRASALASQGAVVVVLDYYRGGRDSYHGSPNERSEELWKLWKANLAAGLRWVDGNRRGLSWTIEFPAGRPADLVGELAPANFEVRESP